MLEKKNLLEKSKIYSKLKAHKIFQIILMRTDSSAPSSAVVNDFERLGCSVFVCSIS